MAYIPRVYRTGDIAAAWCKMLLYGFSGSGKTPIAATAPNVLVVANEPGLLSLRQANVPYIQHSSQREALDIADWIERSNDPIARGCQTVHYDSISFLSEGINAITRKQFKGDGRKYSPETTTQTMEVIHRYLNIQNRHVVMTCKAREEIDQITGAKTATPFTVVPKLGPDLPFYFDVVAFLRRWRDENGTEQVALCCRQNEYCYARNRGDKLDFWEPPNLTSLFTKFGGLA